MINISEEKEVDIKRYSFSRLNSFDEKEQCLYSWKVTYKDGNRGIGNAWSDYGLVYHDLISKLFNEDIFLFEFKDLFLQEIKKIPYKFPKFKYCDLNEKIPQQILSHIDTFHFFEDYQIIEFEQEHKFEIDGVPFITIPDLIAISPSSELDLIDHKISKVWDKNNLKSKLRQLYIYSIAYKNKYNKNIDKFKVNFFKDDILMSYDFNPQELDETRRWIHNKLELIDKEIEFAPRCEIVKDKTKDFYATYLCSHRSTCPYKPFTKEKN